MFLLDTNVVSEIRKGDDCQTRVAAWFDGVGDADLFISVLTAGEIRKGIESVRPRDPRRAARLERWLAELERVYAERILPVDAQVLTHGAASARTGPRRPWTACSPQPRWFTA